MGSIILNKRNRWQGYSYDEISRRLGVVNIINEFRDGALQAPTDLADYIDELRRIAVDLKKHHTSVTGMKLYLRIHTKLRQMGVSDRDVERWLDIY